MKKPNISWNEITIINDCLEQLTRKELKDRVKLSPRGIIYLEKLMCKLSMASFEHIFGFVPPKNQGKKRLENLRKEQETLK